MTIKQKQLSRWNICVTHWGQGRHACVSKLNIIGSDNGLVPGRRQAIIWTNVHLLSIGPLGTNFAKLNQNTKLFVQENAFESIVCEMAAILSRERWVNVWYVYALQVFVWHTQTKPGHSGNPRTVQNSAKYVERIINMEYNPKNMIIWDFDLPGTIRVVPRNTMVGSAHKAITVAS